MFQLFDADSNGVIDYVEFCEELTRNDGEENKKRYSDMMMASVDHAYQNAHKAPAARRLLPKGEVEAIIT